MWERDIDQWPPVHTPTRDRTCSPGRSPNWRWNPPPFGVWDNTPTNWAPGQGKPKILSVEHLFTCTESSEHLLMKYYGFPNNLLWLKKKKEFVTDSKSLSNLNEVWVYINVCVYIHRCMYHILIYMILHVSRICVYIYCLYMYTLYICMYVCICIYTCTSMACMQPEGLRTRKDNGVQSSPSLKAGENQYPTLEDH